MPRVGRTSSAKIGTDALKDALVTLHPQSAIEHLHARFVAADGKGSDGALAFEANEVGATHKAKTLVPVRPAEPLAGAPDKSPIPLADTVTAGAAAIGAGATRARSAAGNGFGARSGASRTCFRVAGPAARKVTGAASRRETQRRAAVAVLAFVAVAGALGLGVYVARRPARAAVDPVADGRPEARSSTAKAALSRSTRPASTSSRTIRRGRLELLNTAYQQLDAAGAGIPPARSPRSGPRPSTGLDGCTV